MVKLLIIDEVHLLNGSRGPVIEALVARTLRQVVSSQSMIRIVALSATLPGYLDVASFLKVNTRSGLFFFDNRFRSVPLTTSFIGIRKKNENETMDMVCYEKVVSFIREGHQVIRGLINKHVEYIQGFSLGNGICHIKECYGFTCKETD